MTVRVTDLETLQRQLQRLVKQRCQEFRVLPPTVPSLATDLLEVNDKTWLAVPGMYGGFSYWAAEGHAQLTVIVESWSRVVDGSGQRHHVTASGFILVEDEIC